MSDRYYNNLDGFSDLCNSGGVMLARENGGAWHDITVKSALSVGFAASAGAAENANSATSATYAVNAGSAASAGTAVLASSALAVNSASEATHAISADSATNANSAASAAYAINTGSAASAGSAVLANSATTAANANSASSAGYALIAESCISGGGVSGDFLPLSGGTMSGGLTLTGRYYSECVQSIKFTHAPQGVTLPHRYVRWFNADNEVICQRDVYLSSGGIVDNGYSIRAGSGLQALWTCKAGSGGLWAAYWNGSADYAFTAQRASSAGIASGATSAQYLYRAAGSDTALMARGFCNVGSSKVFDIYSADSSTCAIRKSYYITSSTHGIITRLYTPGGTTNAVAHNTWIDSASVIHNVIYGATTHSGNVTVSGNANLTGAVTVSATNSYRTWGSVYGTFWRQDSTNLYLMVTASGDPDGTFTAARPLMLNLSTGICSINGSAAALIGESKGKISIASGVLSATVNVNYANDSYNIQLTATRNNNVFVTSQGSKSFIITKENTSSANVFWRTY